MNEIKPLTLVIDSELWYKFKENIPRGVTLNKAVVDLIIDDINKSQEYKKRG